MLLYYNLASLYTYKISIDWKILVYRDRRAIFYRFIDLLNCNIIT